MKVFLGIKAKDILLYMFFLGGLICVTMPPLAVVLGIVIICKFLSVGATKRVPKKTVKTGKTYLQKLHERQRLAWEQKLERDTFRKNINNQNKELKDLLKANNNILYYELLGYKNERTGRLTQYVNFLLPDEDGELRNVNLRLEDYMPKYQFNWYLGKAKKYKYSVLLVDMEQMTFTNALSKVHGSGVSLKRMPKC